MIIWFYATKVGKKSEKRRVFPEKMGSTHKKARFLKAGDKKCNLKSKSKYL